MPSSLGPLAAACVFASTHMLAPVAVRGQGSEGLRYMINYFGNMPCGRGQVKLLGMVCNLFDCRSHSSGECYERLRREWGGRLFETIIHRDDAIEGCVELHQPVQLSDPTSTAAMIFARLADEALRRLGRRSAPVAWAQ